MTKMQESAAKGLIVAIAGALVTKGLMSSGDAAIYVPIATAVVGLLASVFIRSGLPPKQ